MSLLAQMNQPNGNLSASGAPQYYFALDSTPSNPVVSAPAFEAVGGAAAPNVTGSFLAKSDDTTGAGVGVFSISSKASGNAQWSIGLDGIPAGANSGNNLEVFAYGDDGQFIGAPLGINRATGAVTMPESLLVGAATTVGGGDLQVDGTLGVAQVYDSIYNRPNAGAEFIMMTTDNLLNQTVVQNVTPAYSGLYVLTMEVKASATGLAFTNGTSIINGYLFTSGPGGYITDSYLCCDFVANPTGYNTPGPTIPPNTYVKDAVAIVNLEAGVTYSAGVFGSAGINLGQSGAALGGVRMFIQPMLA